MTCFENTLQIKALDGYSLFTINSVLLFHPHTPPAPLIDADVLHADVVDAGQSQWR